MDSFLTALDPVNAAEFPGVFWIFFIVAMMQLLLSGYRGFLAAEQGVVADLPLSKQFSYVLLTGRAAKGPGGLPWYTLLIGAFSVIYVTVALVGVGSYSVLWGFLSYMGTGFLAGMVGGFYYGIWAARKGLV